MDTFSKSNTFGEHCICVLLQIPRTNGFSGHTHVPDKVPVECTCTLYGYTCHVMKTKHHMYT